jgi:hypothetical protein
MSEATARKWRDYDLSGVIAMFIASALQHPNPECNGRRRMSTIKVDQHKNKFGRARVYCTLADENEVNEQWAEEENEGLPTEEYRKRCFYEDALVYRTAYEYMAFLVPQHKDVFKSTADYPILIIDTIEHLDEYLEVNAEYVDKICDKYYSSNANELKAKLHKIYSRIY